MQSFDMSFEVFDWNEISDLGWKSVLLGNGFSINIHSGFRYSNLAEGIDGILSDEARELLGGTRQGNFEEVLGQLDEAERTLSVLGIGGGERVSSAYSELSMNLLECVSEAHISWPDLGAERKRLIAERLVAFDRVYTTNYDLIPYWSILASKTHLKEKYGKFMVDFMSGRQNSPTEDGLLFNHLYDPEDIKGPRFYYLHGALHLWADSKNRAGKWTRKSSGGGRPEEPETLERLRSRYPNENEIEPLFVSEGSAERKISKIGNSKYLSHCLGALQADTDLMVVIGSSLGASDEHIRSALAADRGAESHIAFGVHLGEKTDDAVALMAHVKATFPESPVIFFDCSTHPLSNEDLRGKAGS